MKNWHISPVSVLRLWDRDMLLFENENGLLRKFCELKLLLLLVLVVIAQLLPAVHSESTKPSAMCRIFMILPPSDSRNVNSYTLNS